MASIKEERQEESGDEMEYEYCDSCQEGRNANNVKLYTESNVSFSLQQEVRHCLSCGNYFVDGKSFGNLQSIGDYVVRKRITDFIKLQVPEDVRIRARNMQIESL